MFENTWRCERGASWDFKPRHYVHTEANTRRKEKKIDHAWIALSCKVYSSVSFPSGRTGLFIFNRFTAGPLGGDRVFDAPWVLPLICRKWERCKHPVRRAAKLTVKLTCTIGPILAPVTTNVSIDTIG